MRTIRSCIILVSLLLILGDTLAQESTLKTFTYDNIDRTYVIHVPQSYDANQPIPLVIALHPVVSSGRALEALTELNESADQRDFIVVYPNSHGYFWNDGRDFSQFTGIITPPDDVGFLTALIDELGTNYNIDRTKLNVVGYGAGGLMAYRLACDVPQLFNRFVVVGALLWNYHEDVCGEESRSPVNLLLIHGTHDATYPINGRDAGSGFVTMSVNQTLTFWAERNNCPMDVEQENDNLYIIPNCQDDKILAYYTVNGGANNWPRIRDDHFLNQFGVDATQMVAQFFNDTDTWKTPQPAPFTQLARAYLVYVPPNYDPSVPTPVVITLHGRPSSGAGMALISDWNLVADKHNFITVYPEGIRQGWNSTRGFAGFEDSGIDDTAFLKALIHDLSSDLNIDQQRIYVNGFSNGGFMTQRLACEDPDQYAAFGIVGATLNPYFQRYCVQKPLPVLLIHGTEDVSIPWEGNVNETGFRTTMPALDSSFFWADHSGCDTQFAATRIVPQGQSPQTEVTLFTFPKCSAGTEVLFYAIKGGGHNWPGVPDRIGPEIAGNVNLDINASEVLWKFFTKFTRAIEND